jgi:hypothetical protein
MLSKTEEEVERLRQLYPHEMSSLNSFYQKQCAGLLGHILKTCKTRETLERRMESVKTGQKLLMNFAQKYKAFSLWAFSPNGDHDAAGVVVTDIIMKEIENHMLTLQGFQP